MIGRVFGAEAIPLAALLMLSAAGCGGGHRMSAGPDAVTGPSAGGGAPSGGGVLTDATAPADADAGNSRARPIDSPGTIAEPGDYRLTRDITVTDGDGLVVQASGVRLTSLGSPHRAALPPYRWAWPGPGRGSYAGTRFSPRYSTPE